LFLQEGGVITTCPVELVTGKHFQLSFLNYVYFFFKYFAGFFIDLALAWNMLFSFSLISLFCDLMTSSISNISSLAVDFLKISFSQLFYILSILYKVVIYLKNFAFWLVERDTLDAYTIPKVNELCREKLICVLLDYESAYLGLVGDVNYSREVRFIRGLVCYPTTQYKSLCVWVRSCCCKLVSLLLWILRTVLNIIINQTFLHHIFLFYPIDWVPLIIHLKK